ncbi:hypothetical protein, partial [Streptomyces cyaneofuscatus]|uniref:hypothetical protein n=1 Tax=Streptomyces cyaneofuscatus TaxID=66883 RepID=UPI0033A07E49
IELGRVEEAVEFATAELELAQVLTDRVVGADLPRGAQGIPFSIHDGSEPCGRRGQPGISRTCVPGTQSCEL